MAKKKKNKKQNQSQAPKDEVASVPAPEETPSASTEAANDPDHAATPELDNSSPPNAAPAPSGGKKKGKGGKGGKKNKKNDDDDFWDRDPDELLKEIVDDEAPENPWDHVEDDSKKDEAGDDAGTGAEDKDQKAKSNEKEGTTLTGAAAFAAAEKAKRDKKKEKKKAKKAKSKKPQAPGPGDAGADADSKGETSEVKEPEKAQAPVQEKEKENEGEGEGEEGGDKKKKDKKRRKKKGKEEKKPKRGGGGANIAMIKQLQAQQRELELKQQEEEEEARRKEEEEKKRLEDEEKRKAETKKRQKEKEKARKERLKAEGKYRTAAQRAKDARNAQFAQQLKEQGLVAGGTEDDSEGEGDNDDVKDTDKKFRGKAKPKPKKGKKLPQWMIDAEEEKKRREEEERKRKEEEAAAGEGEGEDGGIDIDIDADVDDWEALADDDVEEDWEQAAEEVMDDWDASEGEEEQTPVETEEVEEPNHHKHKRHPHRDHKNQGSDSEDGLKQNTSLLHAPAKRNIRVESHVTDDGTLDAELDLEDELRQDAENEAMDFGMDGDGEGEEEEGEESDENDDSDDETDSEDDSEYSDSDSDSDSNDMTVAARTAAKRRDAARARRLARIEEAMNNRTADDLRSPIAVIMGHVDTGKTKLLDKIRHTDVQGGEAGGITQQIGATYFPMETVKSLTDQLDWVESMRYNIPGVLIIDTPGHESFTNLRARGSSLCDIAILVVDIMHGLEPQTLESMELLKKRRTPFVVALNKIDRLFDWKDCPNMPVKDALKEQTDGVIAEFNKRVTETIGLFQEQGLNAALYYENPNPRKYVSLVPTSAISGEGIPDLFGLLVQLTQKHMSERLMYVSELTCTVLEVKVIEGLGTTIDVILSNGWLREGEEFVVCGLNGPIVTTIRALLTPQPLKEMRVKTPYVHHKEIKAAQGVKVVAQGLEGVLPGSPLITYTEGDDLEQIKEEVMESLQNIHSLIERTGEGVYVQASTLGSLEALLQFLKDMKIPVSGIGLGPVHKKDVDKASVMLEHQVEYASILAFDVKVDKEVEEYAKKVGVQIFKADIIYHLFDQITEYLERVKKERREEASDSAIFPCKLRVIPDYVFNKRDPIICGVEVVEGILKIGTPIAVSTKNNIELGRVSSIESNKKSVSVAKKGEEVSIRISPRSFDAIRMYGRHFDHTDDLVSKLTRKSIDMLKEHYKDDLEKQDWMLVIQLKKVFNIT